MATARQSSDGPRLAPLYLRAALSALPGAGALPWLPGGGGEADGLAALTEPLAFDPDHLAAYRSLCGFGRERELPPTYPHLLAFPHQLALLCDGRFPCSPLGLVHLENEIEVLQPLTEPIELAFGLSADGPRPHRRGLAFSVSKEGRRGGEVVWRERSLFLRLRRQPGGGEPQKGGEVDLEAVEPIEVPAAIGRRYAALSGDRNPIHTSALGARLFGFRRPIAHGMWLMARALGGLADRLPQRLRARARFRRPVAVGSTVVLRAGATPAGLRFALVDRGGGTVHVEGEVEEL